MPSIRDTQARCAALDVPPGPIDGLDGPRTRAAVAEATALQESRGKPLFHASGLHRVHLHWTAGAYGAISMERDAYHFLIDEKGEEHLGEFRPEANAQIVKGRYAPHTLNANSGAIGVACDAMAGAVERPFSAGVAPLTWPQIHGMARCIARLCATYDIPVSRFSVLTHAEVQPTLGIAQRFKWDITWLPGMPAVGDAVAVGDKLRKLVCEAETSARCAA